MQMKPRHYLISFFLFFCLVLSGILAAAQNTGFAGYSPVTHIKARESGISSWQSLSDNELNKQAWNRSGCYRTGSFFVMAAGSAKHHMPGRWPDAAHLLFVLFSQE